jgi:uncharacterized protein YjbI with pentapeptide repeats
MNDFIKAHYGKLILALFVIFLFPFVSVWISEKWNFSFGELYTFGIIDMKDYYSIWIALFGAGGIAFNIYQNWKRLFYQEEQLNNQDQQLVLQTKVQRDNRFAKGIELLGNNNESARIGAAYSLYFLAKDFPEEFRETVFEVLCAHIRTISGTSQYIEDHPDNTSTEIQSIIDLLFKKGRYESSLFKGLEANLLHVNIAYADLSSADFTDANLSFANLSYSHLRSTNFSNVRFYKAILSNIDGKGGGVFKEAMITDTNFDFANLSCCDFSNAHLNNIKINNHSIFHETIFFKATIESTNLESACFNGAILNNAIFSNVRNIACTDFKGAYGLENIKFLGSCKNEISNNPTFIPESNK